MIEHVNVGDGHASKPEEHREQGQAPADWPEQRIEDERHTDDKCNLAQKRVPNTEGEMRAGKWMVAGTLDILMLAGSCTIAYGQGKGKGHNKHGDDDQGEQYYRDRDRERALGRYNEHENGHFVAR